MKKISLSGSIGCGKSVLAQEVQKILTLKYKVTLLNDINHRSPFDSNKQSSFVSRFFNLTSQINEENIKTQNESDVMLCDSSAVDQWIKWLHYYESLEHTESSEQKHETMAHLANFWLPTYDIVFTIHSDVKKYEERFTESPVSEKDLVNIRETDQLYSKVLENNCKKTIDIWNNSSVDESAFRIVECITDILEEK